MLDLELKRINARSNRLKRSYSDRNLSTILTGAGVKRQTITALTLKAVTTAYQRTSPNPLRTIPLTNTRRNTPIDPATVICFNYRKDSYFTTSCLELKDTGNIKEIEEEEMSDESGKEEP